MQGVWKRWRHGRWRTGEPSSSFSRHITLRGSAFSALVHSSRAASWDVKGTGWGTHHTVWDQPSREGTAALSSGRSTPEGTTCSRRRRSWSACDSASKGAASAAARLFEMTLPARQRLCSHPTHGRLDHRRELPASGEASHRGKGNRVGKRESGETVEAVQCGACKCPWAHYIGATTLETKTRDGWKVRETYTEKKMRARRRKRMRAPKARKGRTWREVRGGVGGGTAVTVTIGPEGVAIVSAALGGWDATRLAGRGEGAMSRDCGPLWCFSWASRGDRAVGHEVAGQGRGALRHCPASRRGQGISASYARIW